MQCLHSARKLIIISINNQILQVIYVFAYTKVQQMFANWILEVIPSFSLKLISRNKILYNSIVHI